MKSLIGAVDCAAAVLLAGVALVGLSAAASAHEVATRCTADGCSHIVCNSTGDRCHRYFDGDRYGYRDGYEPAAGWYRDDERYNGYRTRYRGWQYRCDRSADNCEVHRSWYDP
jgi:hypothetical protein